MPNLAAALVAAALALPGPYGDREPAERRHERVTKIAESVAHAAESEPAWPGAPDELAALSLTLAWFESLRFSRWVHESGPRRDVGGYAISLWSLHAWARLPHERWKGLGGIAGTGRAATAAAEVITWARLRCGPHRYDWPEATTALYATGRSCIWRGSRDRAWVYRRVLAQMRASSPIN